MEHNKHTAHTQPAEHLRSTRLVWTDAKTKEQFLVDVSGSAAFIAELVPLGFERPDSDRGCGSEPLRRISLGVR